MQTKGSVWTVAGIMLTLGIGLFFSEGSAGQQKKAAWQPILPKEEYDELVARALSSIQKDMTDIKMLEGKPLKQRLRKVKATGLLIAAFVQSNGAIAKDRKLATLRDAALDLSKAAGAGNVAAVVGAANALPPQNVNANAKLGPMGLRGFAKDPDDIMWAMRRMAKGGDGLDPDLQSNLRLKGALNGVEEKIRELAKKKLTDDKMKKEAEELSLMAYKVAVIGQLSEDWTPKVKNRGKKNQENWATYSSEMRKLALDLAMVAKKGDAKKVFEAAEKLNTNCSACHAIFK
jgi:hypothetical protein